MGDVRGDEGGVRRHAGLSGRVDADVAAVAVLRGAARAHAEPGRTRPAIRRARVRRRYDGLVGGWMPATRTVIQLAPDTPGTYIEHVIFGDVRAKDKFIIQTWHRSTKIEGGKIAKVVFGYTYPAVSAGAQAARSRGVLSRAARVRGLLGRADRRPRARDAAGSIVGRPDVALLRQGADDPPRRRLAEIRRGRSRLLRQRIRRLPGHLHQRALHQSRMGTLRHRAPVPRRLLHELRRAERDDQHARAGNGSVRADAAGAREILPLHARRGADPQTSSRRSKPPRRSSPTCTTSRSRCRRTIRSTG